MRKRCLITLIMVVLLAGSALCMEPTVPMEPPKTDATHVKTCSEMIKINEDGSADVQITATVGNYEGKFLFLPLNCGCDGNLTALMEDTGDSFPVNTIKREGIDYICVDTRGRSISNRTLRISFRDNDYLPWKTAGPGSSGIYHYRSEFRNTTPLVFDEFGMEILLPRGFLIHSITKSIPEFSPNNPMPPFSSRNLPDGSHLYINATNLSIGSRAVLEYSFVRKKFSLVMFCGCIVMAIFFMILFRDTLRDGKEAEKSR
jgi:hypothetical protein